MTVKVTFYRGTLNGQVKEFQRNDPPQQWANRLAEEKWELYKLDKEGDLFV